MITINDIINLLLSNDNFYIITHKKPDGDTLGSAFALNTILQVLNKNSKVLVQDPISSNLLKQLDDIEYTNNLPKYYYSKKYFYISVDVSDISMLPELLQDFPKPIDLKIDHHQVLKSSQNFGKYNYIKEYSSNAEIIYKIFSYLYDYNQFRKNITKYYRQKISKYIYLGVMSDTNYLKYSNYHSKFVIDELLKIDSSLTYQFIKTNKTINSDAQIELQNRIMNNSKLYFNNQVIISCTQKSHTSHLPKGGYSFGDIIEYLNKKAKLVVIIREKQNNTFTITMRCKDNSFNCGQICVHLNGGGHKNAAGGCVIKNNFNETINSVLNAIKNNMNNIS